MKGNSIHIAIKSSHLLEYKVLLKIYKAERYGFLSLEQSYANIL